MRNGDPMAGTSTPGWCRVMRSYELTSCPGLCFPDSSGEFGGVCITAPGGKPAIPGDCRSRQAWQDADVTRR